MLQEQVRVSPGIQHVYRYPFPSEFGASSGTPQLRLATSGGISEFPYFFQGALRQPRLSALLLRTLAKVVAARFHIPPAMLKRILAERDPVVTSGGGMLRFEGFSACCSAYARVDLEPEAYDGVVTGQGTTNVDFNAGMRAALAQIRDHERVGLAIGSDEVALLRGAEQVVERKVALPLRWLKGMVEVQAYLARMEPWAELGKVETLRFLRSIPRTTMARTSYSIIRSGSGLRIGQRGGDDALEIAGIERLLVLEELAPLADRLKVYVDRNHKASNWELRLGPRAFHLAITPEVWRGFSGEGQVLSDLADHAGDATLVDRVRGTLKWQAELRLEEYAMNFDVSGDAVRQALAILGSRGIVGFDPARAAFFHRELPFDLSLVEEMHPRLKSARELLARGGVAIVRHTEELTEADVAGSDVTHRVRLSSAGDRCTCPWHAKHQGDRGPCKHILAVQMAVLGGSDSHDDDIID